MATTGPVNGTKIGLFVDGVLIAVANSHSISLTHEPRDTTSKDDGGWSTILEGLRSWTMEVSGFASYTAAYNVKQIVALITPTRTKVTLKFTTDETGDEIWTGDAFATDVSMDAGTEETKTFSASFQGTAALTRQVVS